MNSLKKKFGKFAVSTEIASKVSGGHMALDPWCDDCGSGYAIFCYGTEGGIEALLSDTSYMTGSESDMSQAADNCGSDPRCIGCW